MEGNSGRSNQQALLRKSDAQDSKCAGHCRQRERRNQSTNSWVYKEVWGGGTVNDDIRSALDIRCWLDRFENKLQLAQTRRTRRIHQMPRVMLCNPSSCVQTQHITGSRSKPNYKTKIKANTKQQSKRYDKHRWPGYKPNVSHR